MRHRLLMIATTVAALLAASAVLISCMALSDSRVIVVNLPPMETRLPVAELLVMEQQSDPYPLRRFLVRELATRDP